eukprot:jgi/Galph1/5424/GphlegSOOS_G4015.1
MTLTTRWLSTIHWMIIYGIVNIFIHFCNHHLSKSLKIPTQLLFFQSFLPLLVNQLYYALPSKNRSPTTSWKQVAMYAPVSVLHAGSLYSMFKALQYCSVRTVGVSRFVAPILTCLYEVFVLRSTQWNYKRFLCIIGILLGACFSFQDVEFYGHVISIPWLMINVTCTAVGTIYAKYLLQHRVSAIQATNLENFYCSGIFLLQSLWTESFRWQLGWWKTYNNLPSMAKVAMLISLFIGYLVTLSRQQLRKALGPSSFLLFTGMIRINSLFIVSKWYANKLSWSGFIGVVLMVGCSLEYLLL